MCQAIVAGLFALIGASVSGAIGIYVANQGRRKDAQYRYLVVMLHIKEQIPKAAAALRVKEFYFSTLGRVDFAVVKLRAAILHREARELLDLWREYRSMDIERLSAQYEGGSDYLGDTIDKPPRPKPSVIITDYFTRFIRIVDKETNAA
jgi:hypothetical protein